MGVSELIVLGLALLGATCFGSEEEFHCKQVGEICSCSDVTSEEENVRTGEFTCRVVQLISLYVNSVPPKLLSMSDNVQELLVKHSGIHEIHESDFVYGENLTVLNLDSNEIHYLDADIFRHLRELKTLELAFNFIDEIDPNCFNGSPNIEILNFHSNMITDLPEQVFANLKQLRHLILADNHIDHLPDGIFKENEKLENLDLRHNMLRTMLPSTTTSQLFGLGFLAPLRNLKRLFLSGNSLLYIGNETFVNNVALTELHLSHSHVKYIESGAFASNKNLARLDVSHNELSNFSFSFLKQAGEVNIISNNLKEIDYQNIFTPNSSIKVYLKGNIWDCSFVRRMQNYMRDNSISQMRYIHGWEEGNILETECRKNYVEPLQTMTIKKKVILLSTNRPTLEVELTSSRPIEPMPEEDNPPDPDPTDVPEKGILHNYIFVFFVITLFFIEILMLIGLIVLTVQNTLSRLKSNNTSEDIELL